MKNLVMAFVLFFGFSAMAGILPWSRGGIGSSSGSIVMQSGGTLKLAAGAATASGAPLYLPSGNTLSVKEKGAIESNGTNLYWTNSSGQRFKFNMTLQ